MCGYNVQNMYLVNHFAAWLSKLLTERKSFSVLNPITASPDGNDACIWEW